MKNKFLVGIITFFGTILLIITSLNLFDSNTKKYYSFIRKFDNKNVLLKFQNRNDKANEDEYVGYVNSDKYIIESDKENIDNETISYKFYIRDLSFNNLVIKNVNLPSTSNLLFCNSTKVIFSNYLKLYDKQINNSKVTEIKLKNLIVSSIKPIINSDSKFLCLAQHFVNNKYETGFFIIDFLTNEILTSKIVETEDIPNVPKNGLKYSGMFSILDNNIISYSCNKFSKIYFFDKNGFFVKELTTCDKTPLPIITKNSQNTSFYSRSGTWNTNMGIFIKNNKIFVFSATNKILDKVVIDEYSYSNLQYIQSYKLDYNNQNSFCVRDVFVNNNKIIIGFEFYYASFIFSRHI